jgi:integrase
LQSKIFDSILDSIPQKYCQTSSRYTVMPRRIPELPESAIRIAKPKEYPYRLTDGKGLYLIVTQSGGKLWRMDYRFNGQRKTLSLGAYPAVSLKDAREQREAAKKLLAEGIDPGEAKKAQKTAEARRLAHTFEAIAREWFFVWSKDKAAGQPEKTMARLERDVFPWLGKLPVEDIDAQEVLVVLRRIESRGAINTVAKAKISITQVLRYAKQTGRVKHDPPDLRGALQTVRHKHMAALKEPEQVSGFLRACDAFQGTHEVRAALLLAPLVFTRPGELRKAKWTDFDLDRAEWKYLVTKTETDHIVPLSRQAIAILKDLYPLTGDGEYLFPGRDRTKPFSDMTINAAIRRLGYDTKNDITGHGFRAMARTMLAEQLHFPVDIIEHQLAHAVRDPLGTAYNRTTNLKERKAMMQVWADYLDKLRVGAEVIPLCGGQMA